MTIVESALRGTYGRVWLEGEEIGILKHINLNVTPNYEDVIVGFTVDRQAVSIKYSGELSFEAVNSISSELCSKYIENTNLRFTIECNLQDPAADGQEEGYTINGVTFDEFPLANWKKGSLIEKTFKFRASDIVVLDSIQ
ncbi:MAG: phage tail tube protein [Candidatus Gastranaerophilales bacterium]|nr:phage tail tube protein [Candidatus Gastranaerophilales bacterium]